MLTDELADVRLARVAHVGRTSITEMRVMCPKHQPRTALPLIEKREEFAHCLRHVRIAQVPGFDAASEHASVVFLRIPNKPGVLRRKKEIVLGDAAVPGRVGHALA